MTTPDAKDKYLLDAVRALVEFYGAHEVRRAVFALTTNAQDDDEPRASRRASRTAKRRPLSRVVAGIPLLVAKEQETDPERYALLAPFFMDWSRGTVLRDPQQVRRFGELLGEKATVSGLRKREVAAVFARTLLTRSPEEIRRLIEQARGLTSASEGSLTVLVDHLMRRG